MPIVHVLILAITQALTEFLPVSSSGHLIAVQELGQIESSLALDVILHIGTLAALIIYFRKKIYQLTRDLFSGKNPKLVWAIIISTIPAVIIGGLFEDVLSGGVREVQIVCIMLAVIGLVMVFSDQLPSKKAVKLDKVGKRSALMIGFWQALALIPGTSRSGITILAGKYQGFSNKDAAEYSFLIGIPIILGASIRVLLDSDTQKYISNNQSEVVVGVLASALVGLIAIKFLLDYLKNHSLKVFGYYRIALSLVLLLLISL